MRKGKATGLLRAALTATAIKREMKRRAAIKPIIGHLKAEHRMDRNYIRGRHRTASMPPSPPPASTPTSCSDGSQRFCVPGLRLVLQLRLVLSCDSIRWAGLAGADRCLWLSGLGLLFLGSVRSRN